jgi:putative membrane protein
VRSSNDEADPLIAQLPYCGTPPSPGELLSRFNLDPVLLLSLVVLAGIHLRSTRGRRGLVLAGWSVTCAALVSPLCALSVSLFSARVAQHMILVLIAAPLLAVTLPCRANSVVHFTRQLWSAAAMFFASLWFWHMPVPYEATFSSTWIYWTMHGTLFGSAVLLWRALLHHPPAHTTDVLAAGALSSVQMGLLGAILTFAGHPLFSPHLLTAAMWGLTPLHDQQLGGVFMWVPGIALFLFAAIRSLSRLWRALEMEHPA